jgi:hypothetical protein
MFNMAERWGERSDGSNPCRHVEKYPQRRCERVLSAEELLRRPKPVYSGQSCGAVEAQPSMELLGWELRL